MAQLGADVDQLDTLQQSFDRASGRLVQVDRSISQMMRATWWQGRTASDFRSRWTTVHSRQVQHISTQVSDVARELGIQAKQQRTTSEVGGGGVGGPGTPGFPGGSTPGAPGDPNNGGAGNPGPGGPGTPGFPGGSTPGAPGDPSNGGPAGSPAPENPEIDRNPPDHDAPPPLEGQPDPLDDLGEEWSVDSFLDDPPNWVTPEVLAAAQADPELASQLAFLHAASIMPLDDFVDIWANAGDHPQFDWGNDACSAPPGLGGIGEGFEMPCVRHDFSYRNLERIDAQFGLDGALHQNVEDFENIADDQLGTDASNSVPAWDLDGKLRAQLLEEGVELPDTASTGADSDWTGDGWNEGDTPYGESDSVYTPADHFGEQDEIELAPGPFGEVPSEEEGPTA